MIVWGLLKVLNSNDNAGIKFIYKLTPNPEPDRDLASSINASSLVHAGRNIPVGTRIYSLALVWSRGQGQESCPEPWSGTRESVRAHVLALSHKVSQCTSPWSLLLVFSSTLGRLHGPCQALSRPAGQCGQCLYI